MNASVRTLAVALLIVVPIALVARDGGRAAAPPSIDAAFSDFWRAESERAREKAADKILRAGADFDVLYDRLTAGRQYGKEKTGDMLVSIAAGATGFSNTVRVPDDYDPARRWPLRVQLHGGVNRSEAPDVGRRRNRLDGEPAIYALPVAWSGAEWWRVVQLDNITALVDRIKQRYNVDESRIYLTGTSDGGTGVYYFLLRDATRWSAGLPLIGNPKVLANPNLDVEGSLFASNLRNRPLFAVNSIADPLYPAQTIQQWMDLLADGGVDVTFHPRPGGHDTSWWPIERDAFAEFVRKHPRPPHPARLTWETDRAERFNRVQWLVIDELGQTGSDVSLRDIDVYADPGGSPKTLFRHGSGSGRVDVERDGNHFTAQTRGVRAFTLLLSPAAVDFTQPITLSVNGTDVAPATVKKEPSVLLRWAARDNDRTMLYGAALHVRVPERHTP
jgi:poly(3-hydroxybutyrate) depolymerase